jgi:hypothetical protein
LDKLNNELKEQAKTLLFAQTQKALSSNILVVFLSYDNTIFETIYVVILAKQVLARMANIKIHRFI